MTFALRTNGRTRSFANRYCGSKTPISPNFVCQESFFTLAMHMRLLTNFSFRRFDLLLRPPLQGLPPKKPHFLDQPLFDRVRLLEISLRVLYRADYRRESLSKIGMGAQKRQKSFVTNFRCRHLLNFRQLSNRQHTPHHFESHPIRTGCDPK
jgi:hypothetical protein